MMKNMFLAAISITPLCSSVVVWGVTSNVLHTLALRGTAYSTQLQIAVSEMGKTEGDRANSQMFIDLISQER